MIDDPFSDLLKTNKRKENISKLKRWSCLWDSFRGGGNSGGESGNLWTDREADRAGEEFQIGGGSVVTCRELWEVSLPSGGEPYGEAGTGGGQSRSGCWKRKELLWKKNGCVDLKKIFVGNG